MTKDTTQIASILYAALDKYQAGAKKYGPYDPATDQRDMLQEAEEEILDAINYLAMLLVRVRRLHKIPSVANSMPGRLRDNGDCDVVISINGVINSK